MNFQDFQKNDIVAFKSKRPDNEGWFTGCIKHAIEGKMWIEIFLPVYPQISMEDDFTVATSKDILEIVLLERV